MPTIQPEKMHAVIVYVSELEAARRFYAEHLGFQFCERLGDGIVMSGAGILLFIEGGYNARKAAPAREADVSVCFNVKGGVRAAYENLNKAAVKFPVPYQELEAGFAFFRFSDPDGNVFEISGEP